MVRERTAKQLADFKSEQKRIRAVKEQTKEEKRKIKWKKIKKDISLIKKWDISKIRWVEMQRIRIAVLLNSRNIV